TPTVIAVNKSDLPRASDTGVARLLEGAPALDVSARTGVGLDALRSALRSACGGDISARGEGVGLAVIANERQRDALMRTRDALRDALDAVASHRVADVVATDLRAALGALGEITGESVTADALAAIFARFCIGK
ncbi:MAG TPA: tRNA uridine-5-carboxymethylaminomethyl(34) synthesis GTPase MnmE, partial [Chloroflexota bacterium]|nr:tRNA uridine-5-carboxymethylaminomethyl(34) synthesis GTPase MnmE [Chloroflexota bacterium]